MKSLTTRGRSLLKICQRAMPKSHAGVHILVYHLVDGGTSFPVDISLPVFRNQMQYLRGNAVSLDRGLQLLEEGRIDSTMVIVSFDDAYENFYTRVWPILQEFEIPAMLYVPFDFVDGTAPAPLRGLSSLRPCSWDQIREMTGSGLVSIGSHSITHPNLRRVSAEMARMEIAGSRQKLEEKLDAAVLSFAYPKTLWSGKLESIVRESYDSAVIGGGTKMLPGKWSRYRLSRIPVRNDMPSELKTVIEAPVWLEERIASWLRPLVRSSA